MGSLLKTIVGGLGGFAIGGPVGAVIGGVTAAITKTPKLLTTAGTLAAGTALGSAAVSFSARNRKAIIALAKNIGITGAATALGLSVAEVADVVAKGAPRRRRGITASNIATNKRTIRAVKTISRDLDAIKPRKCK